MADVREAKRRSLRMTLPWHDGKFSTNGMIFLFWLVDTDDRLLHPMGHSTRVYPRPLARKGADMD